MKRKKISLKLAGVALLSFLVAMPSLLMARPESFADIFESEKGKIVHISTSGVVQQKRRFNDPFFDQFFGDVPQKRRQSALGSGFLISSDGYIVTNNHVVETAQKVEVTLFNGRKFKAKVVGKDKQTDLALIKINSKNLPYTKFGNSEKIRIGDWVVALGNPLGLDHSLTSGIISAKGRDIFGGTAYGKFLQTDAAINPGNSGGPLFNMEGEVIGINTAIVAGGQGLGFAIPSNLAQKVIAQLRDNGKVVRGWLGVAIQTVSHELADSFGLPKNMKGVALTAVGPGTPADKSGLKQGDVLVEYNGKTLAKTTDLQQFVAESNPGEHANIKVFRNGKFINVRVKIGNKSSDSTAQRDQNLKGYGVQLVEITPESKMSLNLTQNYGLLVYNIDQSGIGWEKGLRRGDILLEANRTQLKGLTDFKTEIENSKKRNQPINILVMRGKNLIFLALPVK